MEVMMDIDDQVLLIWKRRKRKTKIDLRQMYIDRSHFWFALEIL
jgi:hypothetical protein